MLTTDMKRLVPIQPVLWGSLLVLFGAGCGPSLREAGLKPQVETVSKISPPADATLKQLVVDDFDRPGIQNNLGGNGATWNLDPSDSQSDCTYTLDPQTRRGAAGNALHLAYRLNPNKSSQNGFWMNLKGLDARDYDHLELWIKGDPKQGFAKSLKIEVSQPKPDSPGQTLKGGYIIQGITDEWQRFQIPLNMMSGIETWKDLDVLVIGFHSRREKVAQGAVYIDNIAFVKTGDPGPSVRDKVLAPKKRVWEQAHGGEVASYPFVIQRLVGWPTNLLADKSSLPTDDREFLMRIAHDTWTGIDSLCDREHRLPLDTVSFGTNSVDPAESRAGDYLNVTDIGIYLLSVTAACDLQLITRDEALERLRQTLDSVEGMESYEGFLYNYYDTTTKERTSDFISFVDSAWLTSGLMVVRQAFAELSPHCTSLIDRASYKFFYDDVEQAMNHGFYVHMNCRAEYTYGLLYTESRAGSLIAIGKGDVPEEHWFQLQRTFPSDAAWQSLAPHERKAKTVRGHETIGGWYEWNDFKYVPSWGGSLFEALMPTVIIDEKQYGPENVGTNDVIHAVIQRRYALETLKYPVWGMSPCSTTATDGYSEYGVKVLGVRGYGAGVVTPHVSALALYVTPAEAIANLRHLTEQYDIYGQYGFYDAVDPVSGDVAHKYLVLDQGMIFLALANYLGDQCVQRHFAADPIAQKALPILKDENFLSN
jgi:hypothetical protein